MSRTLVMWAIVIVLGAFELAALGAVVVWFATLLQGGAA
jgi:hypothetical protein